MAALKRKHGPGESADFASPMYLREHSLGESSDFAMPIYLVLEREDKQSAYSVVKIDAAAVAAGNEASRARAVSGLPGAERGMSFVAAHSKLGSWIVGVGSGTSGRIIVFDPTTLEGSSGPRLLFPRHQPVLISHGGQVYVISRRPRFKPGVDYKPWFESFCLNNGVSSIKQEYLPPPPFFPRFMDPHEYRNPPEIYISSYAAVGSHILFSAQPELGTYAFHVVNKTWEKIWDKNLPFVGQAMSVGGSLFAACRISNNSATAVVSLFYMSINVSLTTSKAEATTTSLSIQEFPVGASEGNITLPILCPLGKGSFCLIKSTHRSHHKTKIQVILTAFQTENIDSVLTACKHQGAQSKDLRVAVQVKELSHTYKYNCKGRYHFLDCGTRVVAALSLDTKNIELFVGEIK